MIPAQALRELVRCRESEFIHNAGCGCNGTGISEAGRVLLKYLDKRPDLLTGAARKIKEEIDAH